jgi:hypothetical protein
LSESGTMGDSSSVESQPINSVANKTHRADGGQPGVTPGFRAAESEKTESPEPDVANKVASSRLNGLSLNSRIDGQKSRSIPTTNLSADAKDVILNGLGGSMRRHSPTSPAIRQPLAVASLATAKLVTPLVWADESDETRGKVILSEPLRFENGDIAFPGGSSLIVEVSDQSEELVSINAIAVVYQNQQGEKETQKIPPKTLLIKDENNEPIEFEENSSDDSDFLGEVIEQGTGALPVPNEVGSVLDSTVSGSGDSSSGTIYHIEADKEVSVYVNRSISIAIRR